MKTLKYLLLAYILFTVTACSNQQMNIQGTMNNNTKALIGFNINWSFLPILNDTIVKNIVLLKPKIIRYPGGTISKTWDWEKGISHKYKKRTAHKLDDLIKLQKATKADVIFVLNTISSTLEKQLLLLRTAQKRGIFIKYIEIGNEHYLGKGKNLDDSGKHRDNVITFPTGKEYAILANKYTSAIKKEFPNAKVGITMLGRTNVRDERQKQWNTLILKYIKDKNYDAFIYHIYFTANDKVKLNQQNIDKMIKKRATDFEKTINLKVNKEIWITEYGVRANTEDKTIILTNKLSDYVESISAISMAHVIYGSKYTIKNKSNWKYFSMLTRPKAEKLTKLGKMFKQRVK